jgi:hypothetical protein
VSALSLYLPSVFTLSSSNTHTHTRALGGLQAAGALQWTSATRIIYHIGDQPCHGPEFNADYRPGTPTGLDALTMLKALSGQDILYFFGQITR